MQKGEDMLHSASWKHRGVLRHMFYIASPLNRPCFSNDYWSYTYVQTWTPYGRWHIVCDVSISHCDVSISHWTRNTRVPKIARRQKLLSFFFSKTIRKLRVGAKKFQPQRDLNIPVSLKSLINDLEINKISPIEAWISRRNICF